MPTIAHIHCKISDILTLIIFLTKFRKILSLDVKFQVKREGLSLNKCIILGKIAMLTCTVFRRLFYLEFV